MNFKNILFFLSFVLVLFSAKAQDFSSSNQLLKFKQFSLTEGLSQSSVLCILQDSRGFIWFGTRDGLNKYDGHTFITYRYNYRDKNSISNSYIKTLLEDKNGTIWIGTNNGLNKYIPHEDNFERVKQSNLDGSLINNEIWSLASIDKNYLWVGTNAGLEKFNIKTAKSEHIFNKANTSKALLENQIRSLFVASNQDLWICNRQNISVYNDKKKEFKQISYPITQVRKSTISYAPVIFQDASDVIWLGYRDGLAVFNPEKNKFEHFEINSKNTTTINDEVRDIHQDFYGNIWVGTYKGLYIIDKDKTTINHYEHDENNLNSLSQNSIYSIIGDTKGDVWIGTYAGGINYYDRSFDLFKNYYAGSNNYKLNYKVVSDIVEDNANNLWIGTEGGGVNFLDKKTDKFTYYTHDKNNAKSISANNVKSLIKTKKGNFWIGTHDGGLNFLNPKKKPYTFLKYRSDSNDSTSLSSDRIISLFEDDKENIWVGTSGGGLNMLNVKENSFLRIEEATSFIGDFVYNISETNDKEVLLISGNEGLAKININSKKITSIAYQKKSEELENAAITLCAYEDEFNNIWIGTEGDGVFYYNTKTQNSIRYGTKDGLPNQVIYSILPDDYNNLWFSTNKGISRLNLNTCQFKNFDVSDGLISNEFNYNSKIKLENKQLMFGSANGIVFFNPEKIAENAFIPSVYVTSFSVNNKPYLSGTRIGKKITLTHDQSVFSFSFIALSYSQPDKNKYAYKLEGFDTSWNYIGNKKSATYTNLDAGKYLFKVKASNSDGLWNEKGRAVIVRILPPLWKTWWAYFIYILVIIGALLLIRKYSLLRIYEKNELKQERLEKEKIEEINSLKLKLFTNISHDFRTPLTLIIGPLERMLKNNEGTSFVQKQHQIMYRNASVLLQLINQLLDFRKNESGKLKLKASHNNIVSFVENIKVSFDELANYREIDYSFKSNEEVLDVWFDVVNLKKVIFNLLSNAFKFSADSSKIKIRISTVEKGKKKQPFVKIEIKDTGRGIPKKNLKFVFDRFYQIERDENSRSGTGIGLALAKSVIELHSGSIKVKSKEEEGTSFIILVPFGNAHLTEDQMISESNEIENINFYEDASVDYLQEKAKNVAAVKPEINDNIPTLLLVEDNTEVRFFIKQIFEGNHNILEAENGAIALEIAKNNAIDLIISDVMMPIMNGIELCKNIKKDVITSHIPVLLLTAKTSQDSQKEGYKIGADAYVTKPFDASILEQKVKNLLQTRQNLIKKFKKEIILKPKELEITSADEIFLQKSITLIEENINNADFTINDFINELGMSRSALYRKLKALTGQSITEFIRTIKLKRAAQLIAQTKLTISEIAFDLGFNDLKHFRKSFKKLFNELPSQYRVNNSRKKNEKPE
ncbi:hybrid sensor histidine kinase/response regulator transcription factor [Polaribacter sp. IC073]|uniref:hybrid sensor histidine kinase/response regulator transcription factor n=1 Tax=Polaribacter sp. IC073 TaxID=2508540 RepID=UPI0011BF88B8|nr:hybrid sensor histidine kinase/response regulator transcription factor [Polaribacter sp. IC073]TXD46757.1 response regulator [Polaribacter sp. IC073]